MAESLLSTAIADLASLNDQNDQAAKKLAVVEYQTQLEEVAYTYIHTYIISVYLYRCLVILVIEASEIGYGGAQQ